MNSIHVEVLNTIDDFPAPAVELMDQYVDKNPFVSRLWLRAYERELLKSNESALYLIVNRGTVPLIVMPLIIEKLKIFRIEKLKGMSNFYTNVYSVIMAPQIEHDEQGLTDCISALTDHITRNYRKVPLIELSPLRGNDAVYRILAQCLERRGYETRRYFVTANWHETFDATPDYAEYIKQRPGQLRSTLKRKLRVLDRETNHHIAISKTAAAAKEALTDFEIVYRESWKPDESYPDFISGVVTQLADHGKAMIGAIYIDDEPAAAQIWLKIGNHWAVFKLAYRPKFRKYSVGSILTAKMIEECLAMPETRCIDFLSGDDSYKADWVSEKTAHWGIEAINRTNLWGLLLTVKRKLGRTGNPEEAKLVAALE